MRAILIRDGETDPATDDLAFGDSRHLSLPAPAWRGQPQAWQAHHLEAGGRRTRLAAHRIVIAPPSRARVGERLWRLIQLRESAASWIYGTVLTRPRQFY
jgi:hypothetical protein